MGRSLFSRLSRACATILAGAVLLASPVLADFDPPKKIDCTKPENKKKAACKPHLGEMSADEIYNAAYWMARAGQYHEALAVLAKARNTNDPRLLNATGYATRKLGDVDGAMPYYQRALALDPDLVLAREYLGEALLSKGDVAGARGQLEEIALRCGTRCAPYVALAGEIRAFVSAHGG